MSDADGMDPSTQVPVAKGVRVPTVPSRHARRLMLSPLTSPVLPAFSDAESPRVRLLGASVCPRLGYEEGT
jgi:hypothetical protein